MRSYGVVKAYVFGSAARGTMEDGSDVDFLIRFPSDMDFETYGNNYFDLMYALQDLPERDVQLVAEETISNPFLLEALIVSWPFCNA